MNKLRMIAVAVLSASLAIISVVASGNQSMTGASVATIAPLADLYETVWISTGDGSAKDGTMKTLDQVADDLSRFDVVFFGEFHGHSGIHLAQMQLFRALQQRNKNMTLSLEQFERDTQALVDQYLADEIGEKVLQKDGRAWPNYQQSYRPLVEFAKDNSLPVVAANAPKQVVICVSKKGPGILDEIPMPDRLWAAKELHIEEGAYQDKYRSFVESSSTHGGDEDESDDAAEPDSCADTGTDDVNQGAHGSAGKEDVGKKDVDKKAADKMGHGTESGGKAASGMKTDEETSKIMEAMIMKSFSSQVLRDDTMAESIAIHLQNHPDRKVLHLDGNFHSASHLGTVERLKLRMPELKIAVINPIAVEDNSAPAFTDEDAGTGDYLLLVMQVPEMFVCKARELEFQRETIMKRMGNKCVYSTETTHEK